MAKSPSKVLLTRRAVVQVAMEAEYGVAAEVGVNDGVLVSSPDFKPTITTLTRDIVRDSISASPHMVGRRTASMVFTTEVRGNGKQNSGLAADAAIITRLFRMCGYAMASNPKPSTKGVFDIDTHKNEVSWELDASQADNTDVYGYTIKVTKVTPGAAEGDPSTFEVTVSSEFDGGDAAPVTITSGKALDLGTHGLTATPTFTGDLEVGQSWVLWLLPPGQVLSPISDNFESGTLVMYRDGIKHVMPGSYGTFELTAEASQLASIEWTFTGIWNDPVDEAMPTPAYEKALPHMVELARLRLKDFYAVVSKFTFTQTNDIQVRPDVSSAEGYIGTRLVSRAPVGTIDPEATLVEDNDFWGQLGRADRIPFQMRVGVDAGNTVWCLAPGIQYSNLAYNDRNGIMAFDGSVSFPCYNSDDEVFWVFV